MQNQKNLEELQADVQAVWQKLQLDQAVAELQELQLATADPAKIMRA